MLQSATEKRQRRSRRARVIAWIGTRAWDLKVDGSDLGRLNPEDSFLIKRRLGSGDFARVPIWGLGNEAERKKPRVMVELGLGARPLYSHHGSFRNATFEVSNPSYQRNTSLGCFPVPRNPWSSVSLVSSSFEEEKDSTRHGLMPPTLPSCVSSCVGSSPAVFFASEQSMSFPRLDLYQSDTLPSFSKSTKNRPAAASFIFDRGDYSVEQHRLRSQPRDALDSDLKLPMLQNARTSSRDDFPASRIQRYPGRADWSASLQNKHLSPPQVVHDPSVSTEFFSVIFFVLVVRHRGFYSKHLLVACLAVCSSTKVGCGIPSCSMDKPNLRLQTENQLPVTPAGVSSATAISSKTRIRWTQDLHERFVECVNRLGGAESEY
ncbi:hypothetical protein B296_00006451 [Ensete ventricosum]|uniref:Uncharacterized protein n=1 Tax=Ensete ventricosum TaxID=4639 RepID=A0A426ZJ48_ENSVE|nr:hypothetical protein B296_00006451 [Ensete ventricosum]